MKNKVKSFIFDIGEVFPFVVYFAWLFTLVAILFSGIYTSFLRSFFAILLSFGVITFALFLYSFMKFPAKRSKYLNSVFFDGVKGLFLLVPIIYLCVVHDQNLGGHALVKKTVGTNFKIGEIDGGGGDPVNGVGNDVYKEVSLVDLYTSNNPYKGSKVIIKGMFFRGKQISDDHVAVFRFAITCCIADAKPLLVLTPKTDETKKFKNEDWVSVRGEIEDFQIKGYSSKLIRIKEIKLIDKPPAGERYLYSR